MGYYCFFWADHCTKIFCFWVLSGLLDLIYPGTSLYEPILWMHLENYWTYAACTLPVQRKEINVVKARFTMRYSSKKLSHEKVIITASNFEDKLLVLSRFNLLLGIKKKLKSRHFFKPSQGIWAKSLRLLITFFRPETKYRRKIRTRIIIYLQSNWAREFIYFLFISLVFFFWERGTHRQA